jgi:radical SAM protein with 4Fe4S-binding SPASM domain
MKVIHALAGNEVEEIVFLGGDPCAYPRLLDLAETAKSLGVTTTVLSNTHRYRDADPAFVTRVIDCFETTIHGPTAEQHDAVALKNGAFEGVLQALATLSPTAHSIGVVYNITPYNSRQLGRTLDGIISQRRIPVDHLVLQRIIPQGRARTTSKFAIGCSHAVAALEDLERLLDRHSLGVFFEDPFPWCVVPQRYHKYLSRCEWGFSRVAVDAFGNLSRCGADPRYRLGNILKTPLLEILNNSPALLAYRSRAYLPDECRTCQYLDRCGGGCALSCEIEKDYGPDYLYYERLRSALHQVPLQDASGGYQIRPGKREDLSDILRIEWGCFPDFDFRFNPESLLRWYTHNADMFWVLEDARQRVCGYACMVPLTQGGYEKIVSGRACSLQELVQKDVAKETSNYKGLWHIEAIATIADARSRAGRTLVRWVGEFLLTKSTRITASPITYTGAKLCEYFRFHKVATERTDKRVYDVYLLDEPSGTLKQRLERF